VRLGPKTAFVIIGGRRSCLRGQQISAQKASLSRCQIKVTSSGWGPPILFTAPWRIGRPLRGHYEVGMMDELHLEELSVRIALVRMDTILRRPAASDRRRCGERADCHLEANRHQKFENSDSCLRTYRPKPHQRAALGHAAKRFPVDAMFDLEISTRRRDLTSTGQLRPTHPTSQPHDGTSQTLGREAP
jgi:hypothetical protein